MNPSFFSKYPHAVPALILTIGFILSALVAGLFIQNIRSGNNVLSVTGSAKISVQSDLAKIDASFSRTVLESQLASGYALMKNDEMKIRTFFESKGLTAEEYTILPVGLNERYEYLADGITRPKQYDLRQQVNITSQDLEKVTAIANDSGELISQGVLFQSYGVQYLYTELANVRIELMAEAVRDAYARAREIALGAGGRVGKIQSASSGVVQVLAPNSLEVSDYGSYDTSTPEKEITVTVRAVFRAK